MRAWLWAALAALIPACAPPLEIAPVPTLDGQQTLVVWAGEDDVQAFDLREGPAPTFFWTPQVEGEQLSLGVYRATVEALFLERDGSRVRLTPGGSPLPKPSATYQVDASGAVREAPGQLWARGPTIAGHTCPSWGARAVAVPGPDLAHAIAAPDGERVLAVGADFTDRLHTFLIGPTDVEVVTSSATTLFSGLEGSAWLVEPDAIVRLDRSRARVERLDTGALPTSIVRGVETRGGRWRFYLVGADLEIYGWSGQGTAVPLSMPRLGRAAQQPRLLVRPDGALWVAEGGLFGALDPSGVWSVEELAPDLESFSTLVDTAAYGPLFTVRSKLPGDIHFTQLLHREGDRWAPLVPDDFVDNRQIVEHHGLLLGASMDRLVALLPAVEERPASRCAVLGLRSSLLALVSRRAGLFVYGGSVDVLRDLLWLTP